MINDVYLWKEEKIREKGTPSEVWLPANRKTRYYLPAAEPAFGLGLYCHPAVFSHLLTRIPWPTSCPKWWSLKEGGGSWKNRTKPDIQKLSDVYINGNILKLKGCMIWTPQRACTRWRVWQRVTAKQLEVERLFLTWILSHLDNVCFCLLAKQTTTPKIE